MVHSTNELDVMDAVDDPIIPLKKSKLKAYLLSLTTDHFKPNLLLEQMALEDIKDLISDLLEKHMTRSH
jgi:hypothetical protein